MSFERSRFTEVLNPELHAKLERIKESAIQNISRLITKYAPGQAYDWASLSNIQLFLTQETALGGSAEYIWPGDFIRIRINDAEKMNEVEMLDMVTHELWHCASGTKYHFTVNSANKSRILGSVGLSKTTSEYPEEDMEGEPVVTEEILLGLDEGMTDFLTHICMKQDDEKHTPTYESQASVINCLILGVSNKLNKNYEEVFKIILSSYLNKNLFFLKMVKTAFGEEGIQKLKNVRVSVDEESIKQNNEISNFFSS